MCHWRLSSTGGGDEQEICAWKNEMGATSSSRAGNIAGNENTLEKNVRVRLIGPNETIAGANVFAKTREWRR